MSVGLGYGELGLGMPELQDFIPAHHNCNQGSHRLFSAREAENL